MTHGTRRYDSTVARIAGNIASAHECYDLTPAQRQIAAEAFVAMARAIVAETERTEPQWFYDMKDPR